MVAVVDAPSVAAALTEGRLSSLAVHIIQEYGPPSLAKEQGGRHGNSMATAQLATHHVGVHDVPVIVAHGAPSVVVEDLHAALASAAPID